MEALYTLNSPPVVSKKKTVLTLNLGGPTLYLALLTRRPDDPPELAESNGRPALVRCSVGPATVSTKITVSIPTRIPLEGNLLRDL